MQPSDVKEWLLALWNEPWFWGPVLVALLLLGLLWEKLKNWYVNGASAPPQPQAPTASPEEPIKVSLSHLPNTAAETLFGRDDELALLDKAWEDGTDVIALEAEGGAGKTALVLEWIERMKADHWRGAKKVYAWSFYLQGTSGQQTSADDFIGPALRWFGAEGFEHISAWEKGRLLADYVRQRKTLLILDGMEPLQHPENHPTPGHIKDQTLTALVKELAHDNPGLCLITTRCDVADVAGKAKVIKVDHLSKEAGAALLKSLGVRGKTTELEEASEAMDGHALALTLLGTYLVEFHAGDIRLRAEVNPIAGDTKEGHHARKVMKSTAQWLGKDSPEYAILRLLGLFDRAAEGELVRVLRAEPVIEGLTDALSGLEPTRWTAALNRLRRLRLIAEAGDDPNSLDAHPLVREYFGKVLEEEQPEAWKEAHGRLYDYLRGKAEDLPKDEAGLAPLYQAMTHGCYAGRHQEALDEVYYRRIDRGKGFSVKQLGLYGADLAALAGLFARPWTEPVAGLTAADKGFVLGQAGAFLRALGRLAEAEAPMAAAGTVFEGMEDWENAALNASNLSELRLTLGKGTAAGAAGRRAVELADRSGDAFQRLARRADLADALFAAGEEAAAAALFEKAEALQAELQPHFPHLYSLQGFSYCTLLLAQGEAAAARRRAGEALKLAHEHNLSLLAIALDTLTLGRAAAALGDEEARDLLTAALDKLRRAGAENHIPRGLLARAGYLRQQGDFVGARRDLDEVLETAERSGMKLFEADAHLEYARLLADEGDRKAAKTHLAEGKKLVEDCGYGLRTKEVAELTARLG